MEFRITKIKEITTNDNRKFLAYKTVDKNGKTMDVRFTRDCEQDKIPTEPCIIVVNNEDDCNVDTRREYPVLWIKHIDDVKPLVRKSNVSEYFNA